MAIIANSELDVLLKACFVRSGASSRGIADIPPHSKAGAAFIQASTRRKPTKHAYFSKNINA